MKCLHTIGAIALPLSMWTTALGALNDYSRISCSPDESIKCPIHPDCG